MRSIGERSLRKRRLGFEVSHPFRDETAKWMGHGAVVVSSRYEKQQQKQPQVLQLRSGRQVCNLGFEVSHPFRDETAKWMGHGAFGVSCRCEEHKSQQPP